MKNKFYLPFLLLVLFNGLIYAQKDNQKVKLPNIPGYITLKGDFHMHTVFSDGHVWPSERVTEAARDGLDVISITEHSDYEGYPDDVKRDRNRAFEIAQEKADQLGVIVIKGVEISPRVAPYHNNAIFLQDLNRIPFDYMKESQKKFVMKDNIKKEELMAPFLEVQRQNGFVFYNHPTYGWWDKNGRDLFTDIHKELLAKGILGGVEVVNGGKYNIIAHRIAEKYNLTMLANSDAHHGINYSDSHRPMTLVFAKDKSKSAIKDAMVNRRTAVYSGNYLIGRQPEVEALFKASLEITAQKKKGKNTQQILVKIFNNSDIPYEVKCKTDYIIEALPLGKAVLKPHATTSLLLNPVWEYPAELTLVFDVDNILVSSEKCLRTEIQVKL